MVLSPSYFDHVDSVIRYWRNHRQCYTVKKEYFDAIHESLIPCARGLTPEKKSTRFSEMSHLITRVCILI